jgi:methylenetetrahydrofolate reductase (NADPH)
VRIDELHDRGKPVFSFEFFPPKADDGAAGLLRAAAELKSLVAPDFISVTYGAGGSTRERTLELVTRIQRELGLTAMAHLTCVGHSVDEIREVVGGLVGGGIDNVLALRGDPPKGEKRFVPAPGGFAHASELAEFLEENYQLGIGGACYPEAHPESPSAEEDLRWTLHKVRSGTAFLITQLFFDNADYFGYVERARAAGIDVPITPGIMPITNVGQIKRFTEMCGARIPEELLARLDHYENDPASVMATGIEHAIAQARELLERGAPGVHFYTLNKSQATRSILAAIRRL